MLVTVRFHTPSKHKQIQGWDFFLCVTGKMTSLVGFWALRKTELSLEKEFASRAVPNVAWVLELMFDA